MAANAEIGKAEPNIERIIVVAVRALVTFFGKDLNINL
jgi:hypothetical protein